MQDFLVALLTCSVTMSALALLYVALTPFLAKRYAPAARYYAWLIIVIGLIIPFRPQFQGAIVKLDVPAEVTVARAAEMLRPVDARDVPGAMPARVTDAVAPPAAPVVPEVSVWQIAFAAWLAGAAAFVALHMIRHIRFMQTAARWSEPVADAETLAALDGLRAEVGVARNVALLRCSCIGSPTLAGFFRPRILLPPVALAGEELAFVFRHELVHLRRGDLWYKLLLLLANAVHWFNPLVWLLASQLSFDTELACDADVLAGSGRDERKAYGYTVLSFIEYGWRKDHDLLRLTPLTSKFLGGKKQLKKRFYNITDTTAKKRGLVFLFAIMLIAALAGSSVYAAAQENPAPPESKAALTEQSELDAARFNIAVKEFFVPPGTAATDKVAPEAVPEPAEGFIWPVKDEFRVVCKLNDYPGHTGIDILPKAAVSSTHETRAAAPVYAAKSGTVVLSKNNAYGYGKHIIIDHGDGYQTVYAHNSELLVEVGDAVEQGQMIAKTGATGNAYGEHLHFEIRKEDNILNPEELLPTLIADDK